MSDMQLFVGCKHAYLIMAHNEPEIFHVLISLLDDYRNDIFVHVDQKSDISLFNSVKTKKVRFLLFEKELVVFGAVPLRWRLNSFSLKKLLHMVHIIIII